MTPPELLSSAAPPPDPVVAPAGFDSENDPRHLPATAFEVRVEDILATDSRMWVRGYLIPLPALESREGPRPRWKVWGKPASLPRELALRVQCGELSWKGNAPVTAGLRFEWLGESGIRPTPQGWRIAQVEVSAAGRTLTQAAVLLTPPRRSRHVNVVVLPLISTAGTESIRRFAQSFDARGLAPVLRRLVRGPGAMTLLLGALPPGQEMPPAEVALAANALGWPHAHVLLVAGTADHPVDALNRGMDRLRWLFAGSKELVVLNLEVQARAALAAHQQDAADRARVVRLLQPGDDPWSVAELPLPRPLDLAAASPAKPRRSGLVTRHPIVFCHGLLTLSTLRMQIPEELNCFYPLGDPLRARGFEVFFPQVAPTSGVKERAEQLRDQIRHLADGPVNIVAHSMGGLDARWMIAHLGMGEQVKSLTTIATPHRGTFLAEWFQEHFRRRVPLLPAMEVLGVNMDGLRDCQRANCDAFNQQTPDYAKVRYFSYGGAVTPARVTPALRRGLNLLTPIEGPNDGLVSLHSACWGEYLGTLQADHYAQTPDSVFVRPGEDFDSPGFYLRLVEDLARRGF